MDDGQDKDDKIKEMWGFEGKLTPGVFKKTRIIYFGRVRHLR